MINQEHDSGDMHAYRYIQLQTQYIFAHQCIPLDSGGPSTNRFVAL